MPAKECAKLGLASRSRFRDSRFQASSPARRWAVCEALGLLPGGFRSSTAATRTASRSACSRAVGSRWSSVAPADRTRPTPRSAVAASFELRSRASARWGLTQIASTKTLRGVHPPRGPGATGRWHGLHTHSHPSQAKEDEMKDLRHLPVRWPTAAALTASAALVAAVSNALVSGRVFGVVAAVVIVITLAVCLALVELDRRGRQ